MNSKVIGKTTSGKDITAYIFGNTTNKQTLIIGGVHGDEVEGVIAAQAIVKEFAKEEPVSRTAVIPALNLDGHEAGNRKNDNGVDLNRNLPTQDWTSKEANERYTPGPEPNSEPENRALVTFIEELKPTLIISLHSYKHPMLNVNGDCKKFAEKIAGVVNYPIKESIGYPTPGCLGTYYGLERDTPVLTYEFLRGMREEEVTSVHVPAILSALE